MKELDKELDKEELQTVLRILTENMFTHEINTLEFESLYKMCKVVNQEIESRL